MSMRYAILGVLQNKDLHGYAVRAALGPLLAGFWPVNQGQVYATLRNLEGENLVWASDPADSRTRLGRRTYALTSKGRNTLELWLKTPQDAPTDHGRGFEDWLGHLAIYVHRGHRKRIAQAIRVQRRRCQSLLSIGATAPARCAAPARDISRAILLAELSWLDQLEGELLHEEAPGTDSPPRAPG